MLRPRMRGLIGVGGFRRDDDQEQRGANVRDSRWREPPPRAKFSWTTGGADENPERLSLVQWLGTGLVLASVCCVG